MKIFCTNSNEPLIQATEQWLGKIHSVASVKNFFLQENQSKLFELLDNEMYKSND